VLLLALPDEVPLYKLNWVVFTLEHNLSRHFFKQRAPTPHNTI
jgi:hypothetical protein